MDFNYLLRVLLKRKWIIIGVSFLASVVAWSLMRNDPKVYKSTAQISTGFAISDEIKMTNDNFSYFEADTKFNNAIVTLESQAVINLLSYELILHDLDYPQPFKVLSENTKKSPFYKQVNQKEAKVIFRDYLESMIMLNSFKPDEKNLLEFLALYGYDYKTIAKKLNVFRVERTDYMQIEFLSENPELSAFVVNTVFQQFLRYYNTVRNRKSHESIDTLRSIMEKKKQVLEGKNVQLKGEGIPANVEIENTHKLDMISNLEKTLTDEKTKQTTLYYALRKINGRLADMGVTVSSKTVVDNSNGEIIILHKAMNEAYAAYVNGGSTDKNLLSKYNSLKTDYQNKVINSTSSTDRGDKTAENSATRKEDLLDKKNDIDLDLQASQANIDTIQEKINRLKGSTYHDASRGVVYSGLMKDADQANKDYQDAKQKYNDALDITTSSVNNFRQILMGQPAIDPEPAKKLLIIALAGASSCMLVSLFITLLAFLDSSVKTPIIFSRIVNLKLISMINFMNLKNRELTDLVTHVDSTVDKFDNKRHNVFRESLRKLRFEVENSGKKIFLFTSTKKGEGKTTIIQALSFSMSLSKKKILIIDTNFCNNDLTVTMGADPILEKIIPNDSNGTSVVDQVKAVATDIGLGSVFIVGSQGGDYTPSEILPRENLLHHLQELTTEYDYIFLEGPPLNDFSDSKELAKYVDGVIGVFSASHIIKQIDKQSIAFFKELNGKFTGAVLNMVDLGNVNVT